MQKTRASFKLSARRCKDNIEQIKAEACVEVLSVTNNIVIIVNTIKSITLHKGLKGARG